ncbi:MAG: Ppx/GppA family phosphatase [Desulfobacterota bacterium]|nr:Ppx/GppA family phosphatase [Thermodesulfobacteriota bacterium]
MRSDLISPERVASIDIGTNTILLLIAEGEGGNLRVLEDREAVVRLGEGLHRTGILSEEAMERGLRALEQYLSRCEEMGVQRTFAVGTSALREAKNSEHFRQKVKEKFCLDIEVISGEEEARLSFLAVAMDLSYPFQPLLVVDVGGGSTEIVLGRDGQVERWESLPIGIVRLTEKFLPSDPVKDPEYRAMVEEIDKQLQRVVAPEVPLTMVSIGGTGTALASVEQGLESFQIEKIHRFVMTREALQRQLSLYRSLNLGERRRLRGLPPARADVILAGASILHRTMERFGCPSFWVSAHGVRYGLLYKKMGIAPFSSPSRPTVSGPG